MDSSRINESSLFIGLFFICIIIVLKPPSSKKYQIHIKKAFFTYLPCSLRNFGVDNHPHQHLKLSSSAFSSMSPKTNFAPQVAAPMPILWLWYQCKKLESIQQLGMRIVEMMRKFLRAGETPKEYVHGIPAAIVLPIVWLMMNITRLNMIWFSVFSEKLFWKFLFL